MAIIKPCCARSANLIERKVNADTVVRVCQVCHCRHFEFSVEPGVIGLSGKGMGERSKSNLSPIHWKR